MNSLIENPKAGDFRATCRRPLWVPASTLTSIPTTAATRRDPKTGTELVQVRCDLDTTDRATFVQHMSDVHRRNIGAHLNVHRGGAAIRPARGIRLTEDGKPWTEKEAAGRTRTCSACGLVSEVVDGDLRSWLAHTSTCAVAEQAAS